MQTDRQFAVPFFPLLPLSNPPQSDMKMASLMHAPRRLVFDYFETTFLTVPVGCPDWLGERTQSRPSSPVEGCWWGGQWENSPKAGQKR